MPMLDRGDEFPTVRAAAVGGKPMTLPDDVEGVWAVLIFYRGHW